MRFIKFVIGALAIIASANAAPVKDRCGKGVGKCSSGYCCSKYGWCGTSSDHCSISKGCQSEFGACTAPKKSSSAKSSSKSSKTSQSKKASTVSKKTSKKGNVQWAGFRYSPYGVEESFGTIPSVSNWNRYIKTIKGDFYSNTKGAVILIVGTESKTKYCEFGFPKPKHVSSSLHVKFSKTDKYESFLKKCDQMGYHVWLQVEAGNNDLVKLANIVIDRYGHHSSVKGFGVDLEWWYRKYTSAENGRPLSDSQAKRLVTAVRKRKSSYTVFAKHWKPSYMPPKYRKGMIFVNDSQGFHGSLDRMKKEFRDWARTFRNNPVIFQIGYKADKSIWKKNPISVAKTIANAAAQYNKNIGIVWVDFTMKDALKKM